MRLKSLFLTTGVAALLWGCSERATQLPPGNPPTPPVQVGVTAQGIRATAETNLTRTFEGLLVSGEVMEANDLLRDLGFELSGGTACDEPIGPGGEGNGCTEPAPGEEARDAAAQIAAAMFHEDDVEESTDTRVVYRMSAERFCGDEDGFRQPEPNMPTSCEQALTDNPIRVVVTSNSEGDLDAQLLIGTARRPVADIEIYDTHLDVDVDLAIARDAVTTIAAAVGEPIEAPAIMEGAISVRVTENGANDFSAELSIDRAIRIAEMGADAVSIELGRAAPALEVRVRDDATIESSASFGAIDVSGPLALFAGDQACAGETEPGRGTTPGPDGEDSGPDGDAPDDNGAQAPEEDPLPEPPPGERPCEGTDLEGTLGVHLDQLAATLRLANDGTMAMDDMSIGSNPATVTYNALPVAALELNAALGALDLDVGEHTDGFQAAFDPGLNAILRLSGRHIADQLDVPEWAMDEELSVTFDSAATPTLVGLSNDANLGDRAPPPPGNGGGALPEPPPEVGTNAVLRVEAGTLALRSRHTGLISVPAGQCLHDFNTSQSDADRAPPAPGETDPVPPPTTEPSSDHPFGGLEGGPCE